MEDQSRKGPKFLWIINIVIGVLCLLSIASYFFGPIWQVNVTYTLTAEQLDGLLKNLPDLGVDIDAQDVVGEEGEEIHASVSLNAVRVFHALGSPEAAVNKLIDENVDSIVVELTPTLNKLAKNTVKSVAKNTVKEEVHNNVKKFLENNPQSGIAPEEVEEKLNELGFDDEYISQKTDQLVDDIFTEGGDVDSITESIMETVDEVYEDFKQNSAGKEGFEAFQDIELTEEDKAQIEEAVKDVLGQIADEEGNIDPDELIAELLEKAMSGGLGGLGETDSVTLLAASEDVEGGSDGNTEGGNESAEGSASERIAASVKQFLNEKISADVRSYLGYAFYGILALMVISMLPWLYVLIKLIVKFATHKGNTTVKLAVPIWLGWLFFLLLMAIPSIALWVVQMDSVMAQVAVLLPSIAPYIASASVSIYSISWIPAMCALIAFGLSIYYIVVRKQMKKAQNDPVQSNDDSAAQSGQDVA